MTSKLSIKNILILFCFMAIAATAFSQKPVLKELSHEQACTKNEPIKITNAKWNLAIKTWNQDKVKLVIQTDANADSLAKTDWLSAIGVNFKKLNTRTEITILNYSANTGGRGNNAKVADLIGVNVLPTNGANQTADVSRSVPPQVRAFQQGLVPSTASLSSEVVTIYIPEQATLEITNTNTSVIVTGNIANGVFNLLNSSFDANDAGKIRLTASLSNISFHDIKEAELDISNGSRFRAVNIDVMDIESKSSTIEYEKGQSVYMRSTIDNYSIDEIGKVDGRKTYGVLRIGLLKNSLQLEGSNADIKVRNISPETEFVKINTLYADLRLPVKSLTNYEVTFEGKYSSVFAPFEMVPVKAAEKTGNPGNEKINAQITTQFGQTPNAPANFIASAGDIKNRHTKFELTCHQCLVDFK